MGDALTHVFRQVPDLAGVYAITASENLTNCASHGDWRRCPRCKGRSDADILAEVVGVIEAGVHRGNPKANVIVSDWGWRGHGNAVDLIPRLPKSVWLMSVSEWDKPIERGGIATRVGEYSISAVGPGPRSVRHWASARQSGIRTAAEIQFNNTCEIASIPYLGVMDLVAEHLHNLAPAKLDGMLIGWTMGGHPSPNFQLARELNETPAPNADAVLDALARERFGAEGAIHGRKAWTLMSDAYRQYPFHVSVVYTCPVQIGPANPLYPAKTGYSATMWGIPYDDLNGWRGPYPPEVFAGQFEKMAQGCARASPSCSRPWKRRRPLVVARHKRTFATPGRQGSIFNRSPTRHVLSLPGTLFPRAAARNPPKKAIACGMRSNDAWSPRFVWPANSTRWCGRIRGLVSNPLANTFTCPWTSWRKWSTAAGCRSIWKSDFTCIQRRRRSYEGGRYREMIRVSLGGVWIWRQHA